MADHYEALGIKRTATDDEVKKAFKRLAIKYHPDKSSDPKHHQLFIRINEAYEVLKDPATRRQYNREIGASSRAAAPAPAARPPAPSSTFSRSFATASFFDLYQRYKNYGANFSRDDAALRARQQQAEAERQRHDHEERLRRQQHERAQAELDQRLQREAEIHRMKQAQEAFMRAKQQEQRERERERERESERQHLYEEQKRRAYRALMEGSSQDPIVLSDSDVEVTAERGTRPRLPRQPQQPQQPQQQQPLPPPQPLPPQPLRPKPLPPPDMFNIRPRPPRGASPRRVPRPAAESNVREPPGKRFKPNPLLDLETLVDSLHAADEGTSMSDLLDSLPAVRRELMNRAAQGTPLKRARYDYIGGTPRADTLHRPVNTGAKAHSTLSLTMSELGADPHVAALAPPAPPQLTGLPPAACWDLARAYQQQFANYRTRVLQHQLHRSRCDEALAAAIVANAATWATYTRCLQQDAAIARRFAALLQTYTETMAKVGRE
jgi:curved DNA-binding protein CbpA